MFNFLRMQASDVPEMADLFAANYRALRERVSDLPEDPEQPGWAAARLPYLVERSLGVVARRDGRLVGYLGGFVVEDFRGTGRRGAYCPEWGHAAVPELAYRLYRQIYRPAAEHWQAAGCRVHALTLLAGEQESREAWFWNGFGAGTVDAIRRMDPLNIKPAAGLTVHQATLADLDVLVRLEQEHAAHYAAPPVLMCAYEPWDAAALAAQIENPEHSLWLAVDGQGQAAGYLRFEAGYEDACAIVQTPDRVAVTGAYVRPAYRGLKAAEALLDAGLRHYAGRGYRRCSVDFEAFNPEAAGFWLKHFQAVCLSLIRVPERSLLAG